MISHIARTISTFGVVTLTFATTLPAQRLKEVGKTSAGTPVMQEGATKKGADGVVTATFRVGLEPVIKTSNGNMVMMRSILLIDCAKKTSATAERWFYYDTKATKEARHDKPGKPGFAGPIKGSLADVAIASVCAGK